MLFFNGLLSSDVRLAMPGPDPVDRQSLFQCLRHRWFFTTRLCDISYIKVGSFSFSLSPHLPDLSHIER